MKLAYGIKFTDLYQDVHLIDKAFLEYLMQADKDNYRNLISARSHPPTGKVESDLIIALAPFSEEFIGILFDIELELKHLRAEHSKLAPLYSCKRLFVQRIIAKTYDLSMIGDIGEVIHNLKSVGLDPSDELAFAIAIDSWQPDSAEYTYAKSYAAWALLHPDGKLKHRHGVLFKLPKKLDYAQLVDPDEANLHSEAKLSQTEISLEYALNNSNYCILCHNQGKDSCSKGMQNGLKNPLGVEITGCPLEEKISEMHTLKNQALPVGALATAIIDNPMIAGTGHRICNDCKRSCIFQKQEPVDIPAVESRVLFDVLNLPWGFEIYSLLTRWNPLNFKQPLPIPIGDKQVLVAGLGPAGYTLAHYLLNQGVNVVAVDGLKIEPLLPEISGIYQHGQRYPFMPIQQIDSIFENHLERIPGGFGGVAEYGITARWDKNYLRVIRLLLERREHFRMYGSTRLGSNLSIDDAWRFGFDHIALCLGAGKPSLPPIPNILAKGVRTASDFLMGLQLSAANKYNSVTNLEIQLPLAVIGGGLTAVDAAMESVNYYASQVEKLLRRYEEIGKSILDNLTESEKITLTQQLQHARFLRGDIDKFALIKQFGGVRILYRKTMQEAPCYKLNHEEVATAIAMGIEFIENIVPVAIEVDSSGNCLGLKHKTGFIEAKTILVAIGTSPNNIISQEEAGFELDRGYLKSLDITEKSVLTHYNISFFGDLHPTYAGNVVRAMASAKNGYQQIIAQLNNTNSKHFFKEIISNLDQQLIAKVSQVIRLTPKVVELIVKAPLAANRFKPGQFYRLQNYAAYSNDLPHMEPLALTGAWADKVNGLISLIVLEMGGSSNLCQFLKPDDIVSLMGPTGAPTFIPKDEKVLLIGGGLGNAVLFSIGKAMKENGCKVLYFSGYKQLGDTFRTNDIEAAADQVIWCCDESLLPVNRPQDLSFKGNIIEAIIDYAQNHPENLKAIDRIIVIGSDRMMAAVAYERHHRLKSYFSNNHIAIGSINSPMQCMMKEICGQCLQRHVDPITGDDSYVFSCAEQDQNLDCVDFKNLQQRLQQNTMQEKITTAWLKHNSWL